MENVLDGDFELNLPVFKKQMATALMQRGFKLVETVENYKVPNYKVFFFENTEAVREAIREISMAQGRKIYKIKNRKVSNALIEKGYHLLNVRSTATEGLTFIFEWTDRIHEDMLTIRKEIYND